MSRSSSFPISFSHYLSTQTRRNDPVGDLARDSQQDRQFPLHAQSFDVVADYLESRGACSGCLAAAETAWTEWRFLREQARGASLPKDQK